MLELFPKTAEVKDNHLVIGGCDAVALASEYGTPLYVFDEATLRNNCAEYRERFGGSYPDSSIVYACKAFFNPALAKLLEEEGLRLDVVSGGELAIARAAGFPMERVYFNGNNKSRQELETALKWKVERIVVDNLHELSLLNQLSSGASTKLLLRLSPGVDPHTHAHLTTGAADSKFGFPMSQGEEAVAAAMSSPYELAGLHFHIGSQIFETEPYRQAIDTVMGFAAEMKVKHGFNLAELSVGGGLGIAYTRGAPAPTVAQFAEAITAAVLDKSEALGLEPPRLIVEPGRSLVGPAGVALYSVGAIKETPGRKYVSVDGGMGDNIRPALYGAAYEALVANKASGANDEKVTIAGKFCESGDILIADIELPKVEPGDIIAVPRSGAYCLSLASNYNAAPRPAVVTVKDGVSRLIRRRETYDDLLNCEII